MADILIIDDDPGIRLVVRETLRAGGHATRDAGSAAEGLDLARQMPPDAILLDVKMPGMTGWDALDALRGDPCTQLIPVLMLTSLQDPTDRVRGLRHGADDYLPKPIAPEELLARVEGLLARREEWSTSAIVAPSLSDLYHEIEERLDTGRSLEGVSLGRYEIHSLLGHGGMGIVLRAWDPKLERAVALKTIAGAFDPQSREERSRQLLKEAVAGALFHHPNIVTIYDIVQEDMTVFVAMELVEGVTLATYLQRHHRVTPEQGASLAAAVAGALSAAHRKGLLHRDVKPSNILLGPGGAIKVSDFGLAEWIASINRESNVSGTVGYLAPEIMMREPFAERSDLFALGALLYEAMSGRHPFREGGPANAIRRTLEYHPPALATVRPGVPAWLSDLVARLLEKAPTQRPARASDVLEVVLMHVAKESLSWPLGPPDAPASPVRNPTTELAPTVELPGLEELPDDSDSTDT